MIIDSSAIIAILTDEPERRAFNELIMDARLRLMSSVNYMECAVVTECRYGERGKYVFNDFIARAHIEIIPADQQSADMAREAYRRFGKGNHKAGLNICDCFAYALAKNTGHPLLFKGADFIHTDIDFAANN